MTRTVRLIVAFDGTDFHGWQHQSGLRTVQSVLEDSIQRVVRHRVNLFGCGRTDAGVHAKGHVSHFTTTAPLPTRKIGYAIGSRLPADLGIVAVQDVHSKFHAGYSAISKLYRYRIYNAVNRPVEHHSSRFVYHCWRSLDLDRMREAARHFVGKMDYSAMAASGCVRETMVREVLRCDVERCEAEIRIDVEGTGFLHKQIRNMAGTLVHVGRGQFTPEDVATILESRDRSKAGPTLTGQGLCLQWVRYPHELLSPEPNASLEDDDGVAD